MTYDNWKCTDPNDQFLGPMPEQQALDAFSDGDMSLGDVGEILLENGWTAANVREFLSRQIKYPIPVGYFGKE